MELSDKFGVIIKNENSIVLQQNDYNWYFENLIKNNNKIFLSRYIQEGLLCQSEDFVFKIINDKLEEHIKEIRKNLRSNLRVARNINLVESLISIINNYNSKIYNIEYFLKNKDLIKKFYNSLFSSIIGDPIIKEVLKKDIMILKNKSNTKFLFFKIEKLDNKFYNEWCIQFTKNCLESYCMSSLSLIEDYPLPKNLIVLHQFKEISNFISKYSKHFNYIKDFNIYNTLSQKIYLSIFEIVESNDISVVISFFKSNHEIINDVFKNVPFEEKDKFQLNFIINIFDNCKNNSLISLCELFIVFNKYYSISFSSLSQLMCKEISNIIQTNNKYDEFIDLLMELLNNNKSENDKLNSSVYNLFSIISYFDDKNVIYKRYHKELMLRLLENKINSDDILIEKESIKMLKCFTPKQNYKLNRTVEDYMKSMSFNSYTKNLISESKELKNKLDSIPDKWNIINTSYNIWDSSIFDVATNLDNIDSNSQLAKFFKLYSNVYSNTHENSRNLNWYLHSGCVKMDYNTDYGVVKLKMLPLQALILEKFNKEDYINSNTFFEFDFLSSYDRKEKEKLLDVFIDSNIINIEFDRIVLSNAKLDNIDSKNELDLISKFFEVSHLPEKWNKEEELEIVSEKEDVIKTKINHHLKINDCSYDTLLEKCQEIKCFHVNKDLFQDALDYMLKMDFVSYNSDSNLYSKLLY